MTGSLPAAASRIVLAHEFGTPAFFSAVVAELFIPLWVVLLFVAPRWGRSIVGGWLFRVAGLGAALLASLLTLAGKTIEVWPGHPGFPSGHTAFGVTVATFLICRDRRWLPAVVPLVCGLGAALVLAYYHEPLEIVGGAGVGVVVGAGVFGLLQSWEARRDARRGEPAPTFRSET